MTQAGSAIVFTGLTLSVGVGTWAFSALQIQVDMGILLMFMFLMNMVCAIVLLPAIARLLFPLEDFSTGTDRPNRARSTPQAGPPA